MYFKKQKIKLHLNFVLFQPMHSAMLQIILLSVNASLVIPEIPMYIAVSSQTKIYEQRW